MLPLETTQLQEQIEHALVAEGNAAAFAQLERFGDMMVREVLARTTTIESKAQNVIGWSAALTAVLLATVGTQHHALELLLIGALATLGALVFGAAALLLRKWTWPSVHDWFCLELLGNPHRLRMFHLMSLLETQQEHDLRNAQKAHFLTISQWCLVVGAISFAIALLVATGQQLLEPVSLPPVSSPPTELPTR